MTPPASSSTPSLVPRAWDSAHFGIPVARIGPPELDDAGLESALGEARRGKFRLVYWPAAADRLAPEPLLATFEGRLADRKATFVIDDLSMVVDEPDDDGEHRVADAARGPASARLRELAASAGEYSRFRRDPRIPEDRFRALYETWMTRSMLGELADAVLLAISTGAADEPAGMVTLSVADGAGSIGLIAVAESARGRGLGRRLVAAAHRRMRDRGAARASVVTQLENTPACAPYERAGYRLDDVRNLHHFWP